MKKYIIFSFGIFAMLMLLFSCKKYDQDYTYNKIDEVTITTPVATGRYSVVYNDSLKINPIITESSPGKDEYNYEWRLLAEITPQTWVISQSKDLKAKIDVPIGNYYLALKMTNKRTGQFFTFQGMLGVTSVFNVGYYITSNVGGQGKLSFLRTSDDQLFSGVPESVNANKSYPGRALFADNYGNLLYYFTDQGIYRFTANDFVENGRNADVIDGGKKFSNSPIAFAEGTGAWDVFMVGDGNAHGGFGSSSALFYGNKILTAPYSSRLVGDYSLFSGVFSTAGTTLFYDNKYKRFMQCSAESRDLTASPATTGATSAFNMADVKMTMIASDAGQATNEYYHLMQNAAGLRYLLVTLNGTPNLSKIIDNSPDINTATVIAASALVKHIYYSSANKLYVYDIMANSARLVYTFPAGYSIKDMKMDRNTSKRLIVGVTKGIAEGELYFFDLDNLGSILNDTAVKKFIGFGDIASVNVR